MFEVEINSPSKQIYYVYPFNYENDNYPFNINVFHWPCHVPVESVCLGLICKAIINFLFYLSGSHNTHFTSIPSGRENPLIHLEEIFTFYMTNWISHYGVNLFLNRRLFLWQRLRDDVFQCCINLSFVENIFSYCWRRPNFAVGFWNSHFSFPPFSKFSSSSELVVKPYISFSSALVSGFWTTEKKKTISILLPSVFLGEFTLTRGVKKKTYNSGFYFENLVEQRLPCRRQVVEKKKHVWFPFQTKKNRFEFHFLLFLIFFHVRFIVLCG